MRSRRRLPRAAKASFKLSDPSRLTMDQRRLLKKQHIFLSRIQRYQRRKHHPLFMPIRNTNVNHVSNTRHRLNRGGDRAANSALHLIAIGRLRTDERTKAYVARRLAEGHSKLDAIRALKRYIAREAFNLIARRRREINGGAIAA